eukprot:5154133-Amphidinium_carterae.1
MSYMSAVPTAGSLKVLVVMWHLPIWFHTNAVGRTNLIGKVLVGDRSQSQLTSLTHWHAGSGRWLSHWRASPPTRIFPG